MATALQRIGNSFGKAFREPSRLDLKPIDHALAWLSVAKAVRSAFRRHGRKGPAARRLSPSGGSRQVVAVVAGLTALAAGAYAIHRHQLRKQATEPADGDR